jgi:pyruvate/2-oxoglutarate/acetoin dehydrogenase E1 component
MTQLSLVDQIIKQRSKDRQMSGGQFMSYRFRGPTVSAGQLAATHFMVMEKLVCKHQVSK